MLPKRQLSARNGFDPPIAFTWSIKDVDTETNNAEDESEKSAERVSPAKGKDKRTGRRKGAKRSKAAKANGSEKLEEASQQLQQQEGVDAVAPAVVKKTKLAQRKQLLSKSATVGSLREAKASGSALSRTTVSSCCMTI